MNLLHIFFFFSRENDLNNAINWKVEKNIISQVSNGKVVPHSSFIFGKTGNVHSKLLF